MNVWITERGLFSNDRHDYPISHSTPVNKVEAPERVSDNYSIVREVEQAYVAENTPAYTVNISSMGRAALQSMAELSKDYDNYYDQLQSDYVNNTTTEAEDTAQTQENPITDETVNEENVAVTNDLDTRIEEEVYEPAADTSVQTIYDNAASDVENEELFEETEGTLETQLIEEPGQIEVLEKIEPEEELEMPVQLADTDEVEPGSDRLVEPTIEEQETRQQVEESERPDNNPVIRQAVAAYNYQMSFAINLAMTQ